MKITNLSTFGVQIDSLDLNQASVQDIHTIGDLLRKHLVVVIKDQSLSPQAQYDICSIIGKVEVFDNTDLCADGVNGVQRVCGKRNAQGEAQGLFPHNEVLDWHCNRPSSKDRMPIVWLHSITGSKGSRTSWLDTTRAYADLPEEWKIRIEPLHGVYGFEPNTYSIWSKWKAHRNREGCQFVQRRYGHTGLFFPFYQIFEFLETTSEEFTEITGYLKTHCLQEKYMYHHDWDDGDILMGEQWLTIHKRWPVQNIEERMLHRITMDFTGLTD